MNKIATIRAKENTKVGGILEDLLGALGQLSLFAAIIIGLLIVLLFVRITK